MYCFFIFIIQMTLVGFAYFNLEKEQRTQCKNLAQNLGDDDLVSGMTEKECEIRNEITLHSSQLIITRFLCALILHLQIEGEVSQSIKIMKFTYYRTGGWNRRFPQFVIAFMQLFGAVSTEIINIILICQQDTSKEIIMNLLAFSVIAEIDDFYAGTLKNSLMVHLIEEGKINFG